MALTAEQKAQLCTREKTSSERTFAQMRRLFPDRIAIVSEGDSWFAYPPKWIIGSKKPSNLIGHITSWTRGKASFLTLASNGDEAVDMVSGQQKHELVDILRWHSKAEDRGPVDLLLFSGGGNDVVGRNDFERFIEPDCRSFDTAEECVKLIRLNRKVAQIGLAYHELLDIRDHFSDRTLVMTHTYDYPYPSLTGGVFLGGLIKTKGWMKRFMDAAGIKDELQADVIKIFIDAMAKELLKVAAERDGFVVVDTRGTLVGEEEWLNEIHPTSKGFESIAERIFVAMREALPELG